MTQEGDAIHSRLQALEHTVNALRASCRRLRWMAVLASLALVLLAVAGVRQRSADARVLRTQGIVVEDAEGRDRILIGAPIPRSRDRVRDHADRAVAAWGPRLGGERFEQAFGQLDHGASGIVFLNDQGFDRLVVGEHAPDPNTGQRLVDPTGMTWNDDQGFELGGIGCSRTAAGKFRVVMGMDDPSVGEALHLFVLEDGTKGLRIASTDAQLLVGRAHPGDEIFGAAAEFAGVMIKDGSGKLLLEQNALQR